jgi:hypothetical protein
MSMHVAIRTFAIATTVVSLSCGIARTARAAEAGPVSASCASASATTAATEAKPTCCFSNPSYSGTCQVNPGSDETCATILSYLNTPLSTGKSYCSNTDVRGGWKQVACEKAKPQAHATTARASDGRQP